MSTAMSVAKAATDHIMITYQLQCTQLKFLQIYNYIYFIWMIKKATTESVVRTKVSAMMRPNFMPLFWQNHSILRKLFDRRRLGKIRVYNESAATSQADFSVTISISYFSLVVFVSFNITEQLKSGTKTRCDLAPIENSFAHWGAAINWFFWF